MNIHYLYQLFTKFECHWNWEEIRRFKHSDYSVAWRKVDFVLTVGFKLLAMFYFLGNQREIVNRSTFDRIRLIECWFGIMFIQSRRCRIGPFLGFWYQLQATWQQWTIRWLIGRCCNDRHIVCLWCWKLSYCCCWNTSNWCCCSNDWWKIVWCGDCFRYMPLTTGSIFTAQSIAANRKAGVYTTIQLKKAPNIVRTKCAKESYSKWLLMLF